MINNKKVLGIIQVRMNSSRLKGKALIKINGKPCLWHIHSRLKHSKYIDEIVVSTSENKENDIIESYCINNKIFIYRGSEDDLLDRLYNTAKKFEGKILARITGDCPLVDPEIVDKAISLFSEGNYDYFNNCIQPTFPHGLDVEVFSFEALKRAWKEVEDPKLRTLAAFALYHGNNQNKIGTFKNEQNLSHIRITLDYKEDLVLIKKIFKRISSNNSIFYLRDILRLLDRYPELNNINNEHKKHTRYDDMKGVI